MFRGLVLNICFGVFLCVCGCLGVDVVLRKQKHLLKSDLRDSGLVHLSCVEIPDPAACSPPPLQPPLLDGLLTASRRECARQHSYCHTEWEGREMETQ